MGRFRARVLDLYRDLGRRPLTLCKLRQVLAELAALEDANGHLTIVKSTDLRRPEISPIGTPRIAPGERRRRGPV